MLKELVVNYANTRFEVGFGFQLPLPPPLTKGTDWLEHWKNTFVHCYSSTCLVSAKSISQAFIFQNFWNLQDS